MTREKAVASELIQTRKLQFTMRTLLALTLLCGVLFSGFTWYLRWYDRQHLGSARVRGADRAVITESDEFAECPRQVLLTDPADVRVIARHLAACVRVSQYNRCMPPKYRVELFRGTQRLISGEPTACCGIFRVDGVLYEDESGTLRNSIDTLFGRHVLEEKQLFSEHTTPAESGRALE